jgi:hypothetical protein
MQLSRMVLACLAYAEACHSNKRKKKCLGAGRGNGEWVPIVSATPEAEVGGSLEPRILRSSWTTE